MKIKVLLSIFFIILLIPFASVQAAVILNTETISDTAKGKFEYSTKIEGDQSGAPNTFKLPIGIAIDSKDNLYVEDQGGYRILSYDYRQLFIRQFKDEFDYPSSIAVDSEDNIYIVDEVGETRGDEYFFQGGRVRKFDSQGTLILQFEGITRFHDAEGSYDYVTADTIIGEPNGMAINSKGEIFLSLGGFEQQATILIYNKEGKFLRAFEDSRLSRPKKIAFDSNDNLYITDQITSKILIYDSDLDFKDEIDYGYGSILEQGTDAIGDIAFDKDDFLYILNYRAQKIDVYDKNLNFYTTIPDVNEQNPEAQLHNPGRICIGQDKKVYVSNSGSKRVLIYSFVLPSVENEEQILKENSTTETNNDNSNTQVNETENSEIKIDNANSEINDSQINNTENNYTNKPAEQNFWQKFIGWFKHLF